MDNEKKYLEWGLIGITVVISGIFGASILRTRQLNSQPTRRVRPVVVEYEEPPLPTVYMNDMNRYIQDLENGADVVPPPPSQNGGRTRRKRNRSRKKY